MRLSLRCIPVLMLLAAVALPARAVTVNDLYTASVKVADKGADARAAAFRITLKHVLVKVSGNSAALANEDLQKTLEHAAHYVQEYRYEPLSDDAADLVGDEVAGGDTQNASASGDSASGSSQATHILKVSFAGPSIDAVLRKHGVLVWGRQRPQVLVWLAVDNGQQRYIVSSDGDARAHKLLMRSAADRGLPVLLPLMDVSDRSKIEFVDISGGFFDTVRKASARYRSEISLVGHVVHAGGSWRADWTLLGVGERRAWSASASGLDGAIGSGVEGVADRLAAAFAGHHAEQTALRVRVRALKSLDDYARVDKYLQSLVRVRSARVVDVQPHEAVFDVDLQGLPKDLQRTVTLGDVLAPAQNDAAPATADQAGSGASTASAAAGSDQAGAAGNGGGAVVTGLDDSAVTTGLGTDTSSQGETASSNTGDTGAMPANGNTGAAPDDESAAGGVAQSPGTGGTPGGVSSGPQRPELVFRLIG